MNHYRDRLQYYAARRSELFGLIGEMHANRRISEQAKIDLQRNVSSLQVLLRHLDREAWDGESREKEAVGWSGSPVEVKR